MLRRLDATLTCAEHGTTAPSPDAAGYRAADELIADLQTLESGLADARAAHAAARLVRPVRREVEAFRFSTFRLDVRENTTRLTAALTALWRARHPGDSQAPRPSRPPGRPGCRASSPARSGPPPTADRKSTRLNSSHLVISYAVFCLKKKKKEQT